jgi:hypothetical protein
MAPLEGFMKALGTPDVTTASTRHRAGPVPDAKATAGSSEEHSDVAPDLFTAETPLGTYQGMTDQVRMSRTPGSFNTVLVPRGSSKPEWLG